MKKLICFLLCTVFAFSLTGECYAKKGILLITEAAVEEVTEDKESENIHIIVSNQNIDKQQIIGALVSYGAQRKAEFLDSNDTIVNYRI